MLNDKIALVTGATRGIGRAIALELGRQGATVIGRRPARMVPGKFLPTWPNPASRVEESC